jgi:hypothetical protein
MTADNPYQVASVNAGKPRSCVPNAFVPAWLRSGFGQKASPRHCMIYA